MGSLLLGCSSLAPNPVVEGNYDLVEYDAKRLPAKVFQLPTRDGQPTDCWYAAARGSLVVDSSTFAYQLTFENTCTGAVLSASALDGRYQRSGAELSFFVPGEGGEVRFSGRVAGDQLSIDEIVHSLTFRRHPQ